MHSINCEKKYTVTNRFEQLLFNPQYFLLIKKLADLKD